MTLIKKFVAIALSASLTGCGMLAKEVKVPKFDPSAPAKSQASTFINAKDAKFLTGSNKVFLSECNVIVGHQTGASAATSSGMMLSSESRGRAEARITSIYYLKGIEDDKIQALADQVCAEAEAKLAAAGFEVIPASTLASNESYIKMSENGKKSPFEYKQPGGTLYKVYSRSGTTVFNPVYIGMAGIGMAFKAMGGDQPPQREAKLVDELGAHAVRVNAVLDFAAVSGGNKPSMWVRTDNVKLEGSVSFSMGGNVTFLPKDQVRCDKVMGGRILCNPKGKFTVFGLKHPVTSDDKFYTEIKDATTTGDKLAAGFSKAISILAAASGGGGMSGSVKRTNVTVDPVAYEAVAKKTADAFFEMVAATAKGS